MSIYTLTNNVIENISKQDNGYKDMYSILYVFLNEENNNKLAIDENKDIIKLYSKANVTGPIKESYVQWLDDLNRTIFDNKNNKNNIYELISVNIRDSNENQAFLDVASAINGKKEIIVYSRNNGCPYKCDNNNKVNDIYVMDKDEAKKELNKETIVNNIYNIETHGNRTNINIENNK